jgi:hypothetical protein
MQTRTRLGVLAITLVAGFVAAAPGVSAQETTIAYKWAKGETLRYRLTQKTATTMTGLPGGAPDAKLDQLADQVFKMTVESIAADGTVTLRQSFESMRMDITSPGGSVTFDAAKPDPAAAPPEQAVQKLFAAMLNEPFTVTMTPTGKLVKIEGFTRLMDKVFAAFPASDPQTAGALQQMRATLSDEQMMSMFSQGFPEFPQRPLKAGDSWTGETVLKNPAIGAMLMSSSLALAALEGAAAAPMARITTKVRMERDPKSQAPDGPMGMKVDMGVANGAGETLFDVGRGRLQRATTNITIPISMSGTGPDGSAFNMRSNANSTVTVELIDK